MPIGRKIGNLIQIRLVILAKNANMKIGNLEIFKKLLERMFDYFENFSRCSLPLNFLVSLILVQRDGSRIDTQTFPLTLYIRNHIEWVWGRCVVSLIVNFASEGRIYLFYPNLLICLA